jgi:hypothetical protein
MPTSRSANAGRIAAVAAILIPMVTPPADAQERPERTRRELHPGSAVVRQQNGDGEALIRILCDDAGRPEAGFTTEANRVTREETGGRYNRASLRLRPWKDTDDVLITTDWGIAWVPRPTAAGGLLSMDVEVRPNQLERNGMPVLITYDMWKAGDVPAERTVVEFDANCSTRDPAAPSWRRLGSAERRRKAQR